MKDASEVEKVARLYLQSLGYSPLASACCYFIKQEVDPEKGRPELLQPNHRPEAQQGTKHATAEVAR